ncbi:hypothetical protein C1631_000010 [Chryseobacterium phosphatilyticum]|uniref:Sugar-binding protein n=1 Tax=Chryseobacterium phosphatilyticum TaxID=475075 RepID=A0A316XJP0_9FLAO|nr:hypothetical protein [Chryseobacterium phosphatilyticum]PWN71050.1 hypothetical protein C1631_000010 [Chryseobacterium phosphatilyticum]
MKKNKILLLALSIASHYYWAQLDGPPLAPLKVKAPNVDAISVFNFIESPVSLHTGLVNISYPIYEIKTKGLTIPINLSYFSRGVRIEDIASSVGMGWSLNYGGMISRQIREVADEEGGYGYLNNNVYNGFFTDNEERKKVMQRMNSAELGKIYDLVPDQFYFSTAENSGKFILDRYDKKAVQQPYTDIKIEPDWSQGSVLHSWLITDTKGNRYYYGRNAEKNINYESVIRTRNFRQKHPFAQIATLDNIESIDPDSWYLQKIITPYNDTITYNYTKDEVKYYKKNYDQQIMPCLAPCDNPPDNAGTIYTFFSDVNEDKYSLESIEFPQGKVQFVTGSTGRLDVNHGFPLEKIIVYDKYNKPVESHTFTYSYFDAAPNFLSTNVILVNKDPSSLKRMFLTEIKKEGWSNNSPVLIEKTKYNYNYGEKNALPDRFSTSKDLWGYYNNQNNSTFDHFYDHQGVITNRTTSETHSKVGILTSIELPTGEKRVFEYENNKLLAPYFNYSKIAGFPNVDGLGYNYGPGQRIRSIKYYDGNELKLQKTYDYTSGSGKLFGLREYRAILGYKSFPAVGPIPILDPDGVMGGDLNSALESRDFGYEYVTEYFGNSSSNIGKIDYTFSNHPDTWNFTDYPFHWANDNNWLRGLLLNQKYYESKNNQYVVVQEIDNHYKIGGYNYPDIADLVGPVPGGFALSSVVFDYEKTNYLYKTPLAKIYLDKRISAGLAQTGTNPSYLIHIDNTNNNRRWYYKPYFFTAGKIEKDETVVTSYYGNNQITTKTKYTYPSYSNNISIVKNEGTDGSILETNYNYAQEKGHQLMISKNMVGIPLETVTSKTTGNVTKTISKVETFYPPAIPSAQTGNLVLPLSVRSFNIQNPTDINRATTDITYDQYDIKGNLQQYTTKDGISTVIIWGYNQTQPIAKIENAKLADIGQSFITAIVNASNTDAAVGANNDETNLLNAFNTFRGQLPGYKITTYSYDPLIGVRSITPPSGIREVYLYDSANRLKEIRENSQTGNLLKEFKYNYKQ